MTLKTIPTDSKCKTHHLWERNQILIKVSILIILLLHCIPFYTNLRTFSRVINRIYINISPILSISGFNPRTSFCTHIYCKIGGGCYIKFLKIKIININSVL